MKFEEGKSYRVFHKMMGGLCIKVESQNENWISGTVVLGKAAGKGKAGRNAILEGKKIDLKKSLIKKKFKYETEEPKQRY